MRRGECRFEDELVGLRGGVGQDERGGLLSRVSGGQRSLEQGLLFAVRGNGMAYEECDLGRRNNTVPS